MKNGKSKIRRLQYINATLRQLDQAIFDAYELALKELGRALRYVEIETRKEKLR